jgi:hypothetical protein
MHIIELSYPGIRIDHPDQQWSWEVLNQIHDFEAPLAEAALALTWFEDQSIASPVIHYLDPKTEWQRVQEITEKIVSESKLDPSTITREEQIRLNTEITLTLKRERWGSGSLPENYSHRIVFIHAKTFLYSLDRIDRLLRVLETTLGDQFDISRIRATFSASVPNLRAVRNSVAHYEDRSRGLGPDRQPIDLKPVSNSLTHFPGGALILECINGTKFGSTLTDGHYGEVDVSLPTLKASGAAIQSVINLFKWKGTPTHWPR